MAILSGIFGEVGAFDDNSEVLDGIAGAIRIQPKRVIFPQESF